MEIDEAQGRYHSEDEGVVEDQDWNLSEIDPNDYYLPEESQRILEIQELSNLSLDMIKKGIIEYWRSKDGTKEERELMLGGIDEAFSSLSRRIITTEKLVGQELLETPEDGFVSRNVNLENDYLPQINAQHEEANRLKDLEEGSIIIHIDVRRAFDNISPKLCCNILKKMADSEEFKIIKPLKNIISKWMVTSASEQIKIEGYEEFKRYYGGPQGSLWTPAIWNLYLTSVLKNSPLRKMIRLYADNVFIWIAKERVKYEYIKKTMDLVKRLLKLANLDINEDEIFAYWRGEREEYLKIMTQIIKIEEVQRILGFWFKLNKGRWNYQVKFWLPLSPRRSLINITFSQRIYAFKAKGLGSLYYQIQGWFMFGKPNDEFDWKGINQKIRVAFINWTGLVKVSYLDLAALGILLRPYLIDKLTAAYCHNYLLNRKDNPNRQKIDVPYKWITSLLQDKYLDLDIQGKKLAEQFDKMGQNFASHIAREPDKIKEWLDTLIDQVNSEELFRDNDGKYGNFYKTTYEDKPYLKFWEKLENYHRYFSIRRRYKDEYLLNLDNKIRWQNRAFWHLCLGKDPNRKDAIQFCQTLKQALTQDKTWTYIVMKAMEIEDKVIENDEKIRDFLKEHDWELLDDIMQIMDSALAGDKDWRRQQLLLICFKYRKDTEIDKKYLNFLEIKCQMLKCKDK